MSHNTALGSPPHVLSVTPSSFSTAGIKTFTINGNNLSTSCQLSIPAALGTVVGAPTYTASSGTQGDLVYTIDVAAIPSTATSRVLTLSNGGHASTGATVQTLHGWNPGALCTGPTDYWFNPDATGLVDGANIPSLTSTTGGLTLTQGTGGAQPIFYENHAWSAGKTPAAIGKSPAGPLVTDTRGFDSTVIPLTDTGGVFEWSIGFVAQNLTNNLTTQFAWLAQTRVGSSPVGTGYRNDNGWNSYAPSTNSYAPSTADTWNNVNQIVKPLTVGAGGTATLTIPSLSVNHALSYTPATAPSGAGRLFYQQNGPTVFGELLIVCRALDAGEITLLRDYWDDKYGS
jgi:hypothetical protein